MTTEITAAAVHYLREAGYEDAADTLEAHARGPHGQGYTRTVDLAHWDYADVFGHQTSTNVASPPHPRGEQVILPNHYGRHTIEPIRFAVENFGTGFLIGNAVKYLARYDAKDGHKDLAKAARYVEMLRHYEAGDANWYAPKGDVSILPVQSDAPLRSLHDKAPRHG